MIEVGRLCVKIAGRDSKLKCLIVDIIDDNHVLIDGETRRRKCNVLHLYPLKTIVEIKKGASHEDVVAAFKTLDIEIKDKKAKPKPVARPRKQRKVREKLAPKKSKATSKPAKKTEASAPKKEEKTPVKKEAPAKEEPKEDSPKPKETENKE